MTHDPVARARAMLADRDDQRGASWPRWSAEELIEMADRVETLGMEELEEFAAQWEQMFGFSLFGRRTDAPCPRPTAEPEDDDTMLDRAQVTRMVGVSVSTLKRMEADGRFPPPIQITERRVGWPLHVVRDWLDNRPRKRVA